MDLKANISWKSLITVALVLMLVGPTMTGSVTADDDPEDASDGEQSNKPQQHSVSEEDVERFIEIWTERTQEEGLLDRYVEGEVTFDDGFEDLSRADQEYLVSRLVDDWIENLPGFSEDLEANDPEGTGEYRESVEGLFRMVIFNRDNFMASLEDFAEAPQEPQEEHPVAPRDAGIDNYPGLSHDEIVAKYDERKQENLVPMQTPSWLQDLEAVERLDVPEVPFSNLPGGEISLPQPIEADAPLQDAVPIEPSPVTLEGPKRLAGELLSDTLPTLPNTPLERDATEPSDDETGPIPNVDPDPGPLPPLPLPAILPDAPMTHEDPQLTIATSGHEGLLQQLGNLVDSTTYVACGQQDGHEIVCSDPVPLGTPVPLDLDGDGAPLGHDVIAHLAPRSRPDHPMGFGVHLSVERAETHEEAGDLPAKVFVVYRYQEAFQITTGFDATQSTLSDVQEASVMVKDVTDIVRGIMDILIEVTHENPADRAALFVEHAPLDTTQNPAEPRDPVYSELLFDPLPQELVADFSITRDELDGTTAVDVHIDTDLSPVIHGIFQATRGEAFTDIAFMIDRFPEQVTAGATMGPGNNFEARYDASSTIDNITFAARQFRDSDPERFTQILGHVEGLPEDIAITFEAPISVDYEASSRIPNVTVALERYDQGLDSQFVANLQGIPAGFTIDGTLEPVLIEYEATGELDLFDVGMQQRSNALTGNLTITGLPESLVFEMDNHETQVQLNRPLPLLEAKIQVGSAAPEVLPIDHVSFNQTAPDSYAGSLRVSGFTSARLDTGQQDHIEAMVEIAGGDPFRVWADDRVTDAHLDVLISNLPEVIELTHGPESLHYRSSDVIDRIDVLVKLGELNSTVVLEGFPDEFELDWGGDVVSYIASQKIDRIQASVAHAGIAVENLHKIDRIQTSADPVGVPLEAHMEIFDFPAELHVYLDPDYPRFEAPDNIGRVSGNVSLGGTQPLRLDGSHLSVHVDGSNAMAFSGQMDGIERLAFDQREPDATAGHFEASDPQALAFRLVDTPNAVFVDGVVENLPDAISIVLEKESFSYAASDEIGLLDIHVEMPELVAEVTLTQIPATVDIDWSDGNLDYVASSSLGSLGLQAEVFDPQVVLNVTVESIPETFGLQLTQTGAEFATPTSVGSVRVLASLNDGAVLAPGEAYEGDHLLVTVDEDAIGVNLKASGIQRIAMDSDETVNATLGFSPGGQAFLGFAQIDDMSAILTVSNLPSLMSFGIDAIEGLVNYRGSDVVDEIAVGVDVPEEELNAALLLEGLPAELDVSWGVDSRSPVIVYEASHRLERVFLRVEVEDIILFGDIQDVARYVEVQISDDTYSVETRRGRDGGLSHIGSVAAGFTTVGVLLELPGNHALLVHRDPEDPRDHPPMQASFRYDGLRSAQVTLTDDGEFEFQMRNRDARVFTAMLDLEDLEATLVIDSIPQHFVARTDGPRILYDAFGSVIDEIALEFTNREDVELTVGVQRLPSRLTITVDNTTEEIVKYHSLGRLESLSMDARFDTWEASFRIDDVAPRWSVIIDDGAFVFGSPTFPGTDQPVFTIGGIEATMTNTGTVPARPGNHLALSYEETEEDEDDQVAASFRMTQAQRVLYVPSEGEHLLELWIGGGRSFQATATGEWLNGTQAHLDATLDPLPSFFRASISNETQILSDLSTDLHVYAEFGDEEALLNTKAPLNVPGIAVRDGAPEDVEDPGPPGSGEGSAAVKLNLFMEGLPTSLTMGAGDLVLGFEGWNPSETMVFDVLLEHIVEKPLEVLLTWDELPSEPTDFSFHSIVEEGEDHSNLTLLMDATDSLGSLKGYAVLEDEHRIDVDISLLPGEVEIFYGVNEDGKKITWDAAHPIDRIAAQYRNLTLDPDDVHAFVEITDIPSSFSIDLEAKGKDLEGPAFAYEADEPGLSIDLFMVPEILKEGITGEIHAVLKNLGHTVTADWEGGGLSGGLQVSSVPETEEVFFQASVDWELVNTENGDFHCILFKRVCVIWEYFANVDINVVDVSLILTDIGEDFKFDLGMVSKVSGDYSQLSLGWDEINVAAKAGARVGFSIDWPWPFGKTVVLIGPVIDLQTSVNVLFQVYRNELGPWGEEVGGEDEDNLDDDAEEEDTEGTLGFCEWSLSRLLNPAREVSSFNGFTTTGTRYIVPNPATASGNPLLDPTLLDLLAGFFHPDDNGRFEMDVKVNCGVDPFDPAEGSFGVNL